MSKAGPGADAASGLEVRGEEEKAKEALKKQLFKGVCLSWFFAVVAHTLNIQSEAILIKEACGGDLTRAARLSSFANAATSVLGVAVNQVGGKLSDAMGRSLFYQLGPVAQFIAGMAVAVRPRSTVALLFSKVLRGIFTTFSGTIMCTSGMRDVFKGQEFGAKVAEAGSVIGIAIMIGPVIEGLMLRYLGKGAEAKSYLALGVLGLVAAASNRSQLPETLPPEERAPMDTASMLAGANPFTCLKLYTHGTPALRKLVTISALQTMIDGKNMSDLAQIWMREHLQLSVESIRNFIVSFGLAQVIAGKKLCPFLLKNLSVWGYTSFTNMTNAVAFTLRGLAEKKVLFFGMLPLMLPGVNGQSNLAIMPIINDLCQKSGFGIGESTAWLNNLRVVLSAVAAMLYGNCYAVFRKSGINPGLAFAVAGFIGAVVPQLLLMLTVDPKMLDKGK